MSIYLPYLLFGLSVFTFVVLHFLSFALLLLSWFLIAETGFSLYSAITLFFLYPSIKKILLPFRNVFVLLIVLYYPIFVGLVRLFFIIATYFVVFWLFFSFFSLLHPGYNLLWFVLFCQAASSKNWQLFFGYWLRRRYFLNFALQTFVDKPRIWLSGCLSFFLRAFLPL